MPDLRNLTGVVTGFFAKDRKLKIIVLTGLVGMALILVSQFQRGDKGEAPAVSASAVNAVNYADEYAAQMELRLLDMITQVAGVGEARVMVTLADSGQRVYVQQENRNLDKNIEPGESGNRVNSKENIQQSYIMVESGYGQKEPLLKTELEPKIQGVVVICEGGGDLMVEQSIINIVTTALNIPTTRVCVERIAPTDQAVRP